MVRYMALIKVLETGSFSRAAQELGYTQSAVSQMIKSLEAEFSTTLLLRSRGGLALTADGEQYLPYLRGLYNAYWELTEKRKEMQSLQGGMIRIGTVASVSCNWLPGLMKSFKERYPSVEFSLQQKSEYSGITSIVKDGSVDFGFVNPAMAADLQTITLASDELLAVLPPGHPLARQETVALQQLARAPFILLEVGAQSEYMQYFEQHKLKPNIQYGVFDDYTIMAMVEKGMGVSILPKLILLRSGYDLAVRPITPALHRTMGIAYKEKAMLPIAARMFIDHIIEQKASL